jgi:nucleotide-binding universal stress UspA family protein
MKILLAVDGSSYTKHMLAYLAAHPEILGAAPQITALTVISGVPPQVTHYVDKSSLGQYYQDQADAVLKPVTAFAAETGWNITARHVVGHAPKEIAAAAKEGQFDLLVMGSHGNGTVSSLLLGSVVSGTIALCKTPLLLIR